MAVERVCAERLHPPNQKENAMSDDEDWDCPEDHASFNARECTCEHTDEEHGWGSCNVPNCPCGACWEE